MQAATSSGHPATLPRILDSLLGGAIAPWSISVVPADVADGELSWSRNLNARVRASPVTYMLGGRRFVAIAAGKDVLTSALPPAELP